MTSMTTEHDDKGPAAIAPPTSPPVSVPPMTPPLTVPAPAPPSPLTVESHWLRRWLRTPDIWLLASMLLLAMVGMSIAQAFEKRGWLVWGFIAIIYGGISLWLGWRRARSAGTSFWPDASRHIFHWLGLFLALKLMFALEFMGFFDKVVVGDVALLLLALTCFFAGLHLEWLFLIVALFVGIMSYLDAYYTENMWLSTALTAVLAVGGAGLLYKVVRPPALGAPQK